MIDGSIDDRDGDNNDSRLDNDDLGDNYDAHVDDAYNDGDDNDW